MTQKIEVLLVCDMPGHDDDSGQDDVETVLFMADGHDLEIELCGEHSAALREGIRPYAEHARHSHGRVRVSKPKKRRVRSREDIDAIRTWARQRGYQVSDRGRIARHIQEEYDQAHLAVA